MRRRPSAQVCFEPGAKASLLSVGAESGMYHWSVTGKLQTRAVCSSPSAFALAARRSGGASSSVVAVGGASRTIDIFCELTHPAYSIPVPA